jgi:hypothetical protein
MRLNEIEGNTADEVLVTLDEIYRRLRIFSNTLNPSVDLRNATSYYLAMLDQDKENLDYWILKDKRINNIYVKIQNMRD